MSLSKTFIVPSNHEDAKALLKKKKEEVFLTMKKQKEEEQKNTTGDTDDVNVMPDETPNEGTSSKEDLQAVGKGELLNLDIQNREKSQKCIEGYFLHDQDQDNKEEKFDKIAADMEEIKIMLSSFSLQNTNFKKVNLENIGDAGIRDANTIKEINHCDIEVEILDYGCRVMCKICHVYIQSHSMSQRFV